MSDWKVQLFDCFARPILCLVAACVPCGVCWLQIYAVDQIVQGGKLTPYLLVCCIGVIGHALNREAIRNKLGYGGSCPGSCILWCCLPCCSGIQEYREAFPI